MSGGRRGGAFGGERGPEAGGNVLQGLGHDGGVRQHGHEVRVAVPPRNDVDVEVFLDPGAAKRLVGLPSDGSDKWEYWINHPQILAACKDIVTAGNKALLEAPESLKWEQVRKFTLCPGELTIENGLRTNTNKPKNKEVRKLFADKVTKMYG